MPHKTDFVDNPQVERKKHVIAWELYRDMGVKRSYRQVADRLGHSVTSVSRWAKEFGWDTRLNTHMQSLDQLQSEGVLVKTGDPFVDMVNILLEQTRALIDGAFPRDVRTGQITPTIRIKDVDSLAKVMREYRSILEVYLKLYQDYKPPKAPGDKTNIINQFNIAMGDMPQDERIAAMRELHGTLSGRNKPDAGSVTDADYTTLPKQGDGD